MNIINKIFTAYEERIRILYALKKHIKIYQKVLNKLDIPEDDLRKKRFNELATGADMMSRLGIFKKMERDRCKG